MSGTTKKIDGLHRKVVQSAQEFMFGVEQAESGTHEEIDAWGNVNAVFVEEVPPLLQDLERDLRTILGIDESLGSNRESGDRANPEIPRRYDDDSENGG